MSLTTHVRFGSTSNQQRIGTYKFCKVLRFKYVFVHFFFSFLSATFSLVETKIHFHTLKYSCIIPKFVDASTLICNATKHKLKIENKIKCQNEDVKKCFWDSLHIRTCEGYMHPPHKVGQSSSAQEPLKPHEPHVTCHVPA
jgi:hypothetical protein